MPRHYTANFNFRLTGDLPLQREQPLHTQQVQGDSVWLQSGDEVVVAQIAVIPEDSVDTVWVKLARDQMTQGWVREGRMMESVVPSDPISEFINLFSSRHTNYFMSFSLLMLLVWLWMKSKRYRMPVVHYDDIGSGYPAAFCLTLSASALLYAWIQKYHAEAWQEYYFHPSLNPFGQPWIVAIFLCSVWALTVMALATADEMLRLLKGRGLLFYGATLVAVAMVDYMFFTVAPFPWVSVPCFIIYLIYALYQMYGKN